METRSGRQLTLGVSLSEAHHFANFIGGENQPALAALRRLAGGACGPLVYLWGSAGSGKTHLLEAACAEAGAGGRTTAYLPLGTSATLDPTMLAGLEIAHLICIDDVHAIAGHRLWEEALFHLYNQAESSGVPMAAAADRPPLDLPLVLNDLKSRLCAGMVFRTRELDDHDRGRALAARARARGLEFPEEAVRYLLSRGPRDMHSLMAVLDRLDALSLSEQRRLTVPLVREVLVGRGN
jgi:DnaA family protein